MKQQLDIHDYCMDQERSLSIIFGTSKHAVDIIRLQVSISILKIAYTTSEYFNTKNCILPWEFNIITTNINFIISYCSHQPQASLPATMTDRFLPIVITRSKMPARNV